MTFVHLDKKLPTIKRRTIDGVRYYTVKEKEETKIMVSITSVISHYNKEIFSEWRKRVGNEEAERVIKASTTRGTGMHTLIEHHLLNQLPPIDDVPEISAELFELCKEHLDKINNIHTLEGSVYSDILSVAGTTDCIAEYEGELSVIDFKSSAKIKPIKWVEGYFVQAMFYGMAYYEMTGIPIKKLVIIMSCEDGTTKVYQEYNLDKYMKLVLQYVKKFLKDKLA